MSDQELTPIQELSLAVQKFANATCPEPGPLVTSFLVVLEWSRFSDAGDQLYAIDYASDGGGMAATLGLAHAGVGLVERDTLEDEDDG